MFELEILDHFHKVVMYTSISDHLNLISYCDLALKFIFFDFPLISLITNNSMLPNKSFPLIMNNYIKSMLKVYTIDFGLP